METVIKMNLKGHTQGETNVENLSDIWGTIGSVTKSDVRIAVLKDEIELYKSRIEPTGTGYLYDAINQLKRRIEELSITDSEKVANYVDESSLH